MQVHAGPGRQQGSLTGVAEDQELPCPRLLERVGFRVWPRRVHGIVATVVVGQAPSAVPTEGR